MQTPAAHIYVKQKCKNTKQSLFQGLNMKQNYLRGKTPGAHGLTQEMWHRRRMKRQRPEGHRDSGHQEKDTGETITQESSSGKTRQEVKQEITHRGQSYKIKQETSSKKLKNTETTETQVQVKDDFMILSYGLVNIM